MFQGHDARDRDHHGLGHPFESPGLRLEVHQNRPLSGHAPHEATAGETGDNQRRGRNDVGQIGGQLAEKIRQDRKSQNLNRRNNEYRRTIQNTEDPISFGAIARVPLASRAVANPFSSGRR